MVLSTALFDKPAFKNLIVNGLVLAEDGHKMSKSKQNYPDPSIILNEYGADALRVYLMNSPVVHAEALRYLFTFAKKKKTKKSTKTVMYIQSKGCRPNYVGKILNDVTYASL